MPKNPYGKNESTKKNTSYETDDMFSRMSKLASNNFNISGTTYQTTKKSTTTSNSGSKTASASGSYTTRNTTVQDNKDEEEQKYSLGKGIAGVTRQGIQQVAQGFADTLAFGEDLFWSPYELLTGQQLGSVSDRKPLNRLAGGVREETQAVYDKYASNVEAGGTAAKIFDEYGTATIASIPQALMALMTAGASATAQTTAGLTQAATKALNPGTVNTVRNAVTSMAKDPNYWTAFAQVTGSSYESAIADMEQQVANGEKQYDNNTIRTKAALQAIGNGLMNAAVEVGGGIQTLPSELQGGQSVWKAIVDTAVDEGKEEVVQGVIERAMQNLVYDKGNAFASLTDEDAVFSAKGAAKEFAGGAIVGGVLGGAQIGSVYGINKGIETYNQNRIGAAYNTGINALIDEGLQSDPSTDSYKMASQLKAKVDNGGTVSNRQAYNLAVANQQAIDMENQQQAQTAAPSTQTAQTVQTAAPSTAPMTSRVQTIQTRLVESGMDSAEAETAASSLSRILSGDITVTNKDKDVLSVGKTAARQVFEEEAGIKLPASNSSTRRAVSEYITQTALSQQEAQTQPQQTHDQTSAQTEEITQPSTETAQSGESVLRKAAYENAVEAQKRRSAQVIQADMGSLGENGKRVYQKNVTGAKNISGFSNAFQRYYDAGTIGLKFEDIRTAYDGDAERSVLYEAYAAGVNDAKSQKSATEKKLVRKSSGKKSSGRFYDNRTNRDSFVDEKSMTALKQMAKTFGVDIELVDTYADDSGRSIANGYYSNGKIVIAADSNNPLLTVAKHEVTHHIQRVSPELYQAYKDYVMSAFYNNSQNAMNDEIQRQINLANEANIKMTRQEAMDEIVANATEKFLTDRDSIDQLARQNRNLGEAILNAIRDVLKKIQSALQGAKMRGYSDFMNAEQLKKAEQMWVEALADASTKTVEFRTGDGQTVVEDTKGNPIAVVQENGSAVFSLKTYEEGGRDYLETWLEKRVKDKKLSGTDADSIIGQMDEYYDICKQFTDKYAPFGAWSKAEVVRDSKGKPVFSVVKANGEYAMNLDFSLVCKKRRTLDAVFSEMINRGLLDDADLSEAEISNINSIIRENGFETACALCFVDAKRYRQAKVADSFVGQHNELVKMLLPEDGSVSAHYFDFIGTGNYKNEGAGLHTMSDADLKDGIAKLRQVMKDNGDKTVPYKIAKHLLATKSDRKLLTRSEFMNTTGFEAVKTKNPSVMKLYNSSKGSGGPKAAFSDVQYLGDILKKNAWTPAKAYAVGGVRIQSFSDYIPRLVFDYIQMIGDLSAKQLPAHAYTKEAMFAKQFGMTGIKINLSLVPAIAEDGVAPGLDANGDYYWYDGQSFGSDVNVKGSGNTGFELAKQIQNAPGYSANCGTIAVGVSDEHIRKMLDDPDIRMVIPYHKSSLNHIVSVMNNIDAYKDYTDVQNTRDKKTGSKITGKEFNYNEALLRTGDAKTAAAEYLAWCEENGYLPKFDQFADNENYYKLLEDFSTYDNGEAAPQGPVTMTFPKDGDAFGSMSDLIKEGLEEDAILEARRQKSIPGIVDQIEAVLKKKDGDVKKQFSLKDVPPVHPTNGKWERGATFDEVKAEHPTLFELDADDAEVRNPTQITGTVKSYRKIYDSLKAEGFDGTILDASSGLGYGTKAGIEEYGFYVEDIEPFPDASYHPKYTDYSTLDKQYDVIISNAVLNVIPQDLRDNMVVKIGEMLKPGGRAFINVRGKDVLNASSKVAINEDQMEYFISSTGSYQKGFTKKELVGYLQDALGEGFTVEPTSKYGAVAAIVTKDSDPDIRFSMKDSNYMKAVESGDMETAQKMVDEAAKAAGYTVKGFHGTTQRFYVFDINRTSGNNDLGRGHYFTTSEEEGKYYTSTENPDVITKIESFADDAAYDAGYDYENDYDDYMETYNAAYDQEEQRIKDEGRVIQAYIRMNNPFVISDDTTISLDEAIEIAENAYPPLASDFVYAVKRMSKDGLVKTSDIADSNMSIYLSKSIMEIGKYDGIIDKTVHDKFGSPSGTNHIIAFESNQIKDASPVTYDDSGKVIPLSERFNDENQDIRYQLKETERLMRENEKLRETVNGLKEQFKTTKVVKTDKRSLDSFAKSLLKDYSSDADMAEVRSALDDLFTYMANGENGDPPVWNDVFRKAYDVAVYVLQNATEVNDDLAVEYSDLRKTLRTRGISINKDYDHDLIGYESINDFRKANMGRIKITNDGLPVDVAYQELAESYPGFFDEKEHMTQPDQLNHIEEVLDRLAPVEYNPYELNMRETATWLANDIIDRFFDLPQAKPTYADKAEAKLSKQKYEDRQKLDKVRQQKNERIKELIKQNREDVKKAHAEEKRKQTEKYTAEIESLKAKHKEQLASVRADRDAKVAAEKQKMRDYKQYQRDSREYKALKGKLQADVDWLSERLLTPTDTKHIPEELRTGVAAFLKSLDFESEYTDRYENRTGVPSKNTIRLRELRKAYEKILNDENSTLELDAVQVDALNTLEDICEGKRLADLTYEELSLVRDAVQYIRFCVANANRAFNDNIRESISEMGEKLIREQRGKKVAKQHQGIVGQMEKLLRYDNVSPEDKFHEYGGTMEKLYREIRNGFDKHIENVKSVIDYTQNLISGHEDDIKTWSGKKAKATKFTLSDGTTIELTPAQVMSLYEMMKREQAVNHVLGYGIEPSDVIVTETKSLGKKMKIDVAKQIVAEKSSHVTLEDVANIVGTLTEDQIRIADGIARLFSTKCSDWGNETSMRLYGYKKFTEKNYFPIKSADAYLKARFDDSGDVLIKNMGFTKGTVTNANNPIIVEDIFDVLATHVNQMSMYNALVVPLTDFSRVFNYVSKNKTSGEIDSVQKALTASGGKLGIAYVKQFIKDINKQATSIPAESFINESIGRYKKAKIAASLSVLAQQPTSIARAADMIDPKYIIKGLTMTANYDEMFANSPIAYWKSLGFYQTDMGRNMKDILLGNESALDRLTMGGYGKADDFAWGHLWNAVKLEMADAHPDVDQTSSEFMELVSDRFREVVDRTQVVDSVFHRSQIMRAPGVATKVATAFMAEATKSYNMLRTDIKDALNAKEYGKITRSVVTYVANQVLSSAFAGIVYMLRDDDDEDDDGEKRTLWDKYRDATLKSIVDNINPLNMVPYLKEINSMIQGYDVNRMEMASLSEFVKTAGKWATGKYSVPYLLKETAEDFSELFGIPLKNAVRDLTALVRTAGDLIGGNYYADYMVTKAKYNIANSKNRSIFYKCYTDALLAGDEEAADMILTDMVVNGIPYDNIINKGYQVEKQAAFKEARNLISSGEETEAKSLIRELAKKYDKKYGTLWKAVKDGTSASAPEETYDFNDYKKAVLKGQDTEMIEDYLTQYGGYSEEDLEEAAKMLTDKYK